jgi:hypothetical protein
VESTVHPDGIFLHTKNPSFGVHKYLMVIYLVHKSTLWLHKWYICTLFPLGIFYCHLVYFFQFWFIVSGNRASFNHFSRGLDTTNRHKLAHLSRASVSRPIDPNDRIVEQGCQLFLGTTHVPKRRKIYHMTIKYRKRPQNRPNELKIDRMATKYTIFCC